MQVLILIFIPLVNEYLGNTFYVPGTETGTGDRKWEMKTYFLPALETLKLCGQHPWASSWTSSRAQKPALRGGKRGQIPAFQCPMSEKSLTLTSAFADRGGFPPSVLPLGLSKALVVKAGPLEILSHYVLTPYLSTEKLPFIKAFRFRFLENPL